MMEWSLYVRHVMRGSTVHVTTLWRGNPLFHRTSISSPSPLPRPAQLLLPSLLHLYPPLLPLLRAFPTLSPPVRHLPRVPSSAHRQHDPNLPPHLRTPIRFSNDHRYTLCPSSLDGIADLPSPENSAPVPLRTRTTVPHIRLLDWVSILLLLW
jgi:hypothetical protein